MTTIRDVAVRAKVSVATVSHVLNGTRPVHPQTRERVQTAIKELGYRPNTLARGLRRNETGTIGLLIPDNSNPFFAEIARIIEDVGFVEGYNVILCNSDGSAEKEAAYVEVLLSKQVDGLILISSGNSFVPVKLILKAGVPCVVVDRELGDLPIDQVLVDNEQGGYLVGQYLIRLGHRRIGHIAGPSNLTLSAQRLAGFKRALDEAGIEFPPDALVHGDFQYMGSETAMRELLHRRRDLTAIFANNDRMALGAIGVLNRVHLRVPGDVSVIGFDDIPQARAMFPALTTIAQPIADMGRIAVSFLLERIKNQQNIPPQRVVLPTCLVERESCAPVIQSTPAKESGILHSQLSQIIDSMKPTDGLVVGDAGLPVPPNVPYVDLAVSPGLPAFLDVVRAVAMELEAKRLVVPVEMKTQGAAMAAQLQACFPRARLEVVSQEKLAELTNSARAAVRTGDCTSYAAVIIYSSRVL